MGNYQLNHQKWQDIAPKVQNDRSPLSKANTLPPSAFLARSRGKNEERDVSLFGTTDHATSQVTVIIHAVDKGEDSEFSEFQGDHDDDDDKTWIR